MSSSASKSHVPDDPGHELQDCLTALNVGASETSRLSHVLSERVGTGEGATSVHHFRMGNGLDILLWPDHRAPVFTFHTWFSVGSRHEAGGPTGMAHLFEHMMFKATTTTEEGEFDRVMEAHGAQTNAATWVDYTYYREKLPAGNFELAVRMEADRMENLVLNSKQLESEREVVINERLLRVDNDPDGRLYERLYAEAFGEKHPYGWPTIGWMKDIRAISVEDCLAFYDRYYAPSSATLVLVGDVDPQEALRLIVAHYGHLPWREPAEDVPLEAPARDAEVRVEMSLPVTSDTALYAWPGFAMSHPDHAALEVLDEILTGGLSSRLYRELVVDTELAIQVGGWTPSWRYPGLYEIVINLRPGVRAEAAEALLDRAIKTLCADGVSERELLKARSCLEADLLRGQASTNNRAREMGEAMVCVGDFRWPLQRAQCLRAVEGHDVLRVARALFLPERRTVVIGRPEAPGEESTPPDEAASA